MATSAQTPPPAHRSLLAVFLTLAVLVEAASTKALDAVVRVMNPAAFLKDRAGAVNATAIAGIVLAIVGSILAAVVAMSVLADLLPTYFADLGSLFTALAAVNTTGWPPIVATIFEFLPLILGVTAIASIFGAGALLVVSFRKPSMT